MTHRAAQNQDLRHPTASTSRRDVLRLLSVTPLLLLGCGSDVPAPRRHVPHAPRTELPPPPLQRALPPDEEPIIRVRVARTQSADATLSFGRADRWVAIAGGDRTVTARAPITVACAAGAWRIADATGRAIPMPEGAAIWVNGLEGNDHPGAMSAVLEVDDALHPGMLRLHPRSARSDDDGAADVHGFDAINHVLLESYLPGVLVHELFRHWHPETFAAQAIAARSFAVSEHMFFRTRRHFDVTNTQASQVYGGATDHAVARDAVRRTRGRVLTWERLLVPGYYSACCGGRAASAIDAISTNPINDVPPLAGTRNECACSAAPRYRWQLERRADDLRGRLVAYGPQIGRGDLSALRDLAHISIAEVGRSGRPRAYLLEARNGDVVHLPAERLRLGANRFVDALGPAASPLPSGFLLGRVSAVAGRFTIEGAGHGHGVGLCQYGAEAFARQGRLAEAILAHAYPGVDIHHAWR